MTVEAGMPFLRVPPFPGARHSPLIRAQTKAPERTEAELQDLIATLRAERVGGSYWGLQPSLPAPGHILLKTRDAGFLEQCIASHRSDRVLIWAAGAGNRKVPPDVPIVRGDSDPWHLVAGATQVITDADDELALVAALSGIPLECVGTGPFSPLANNVPQGLQEAVWSAVGRFSYDDPFTGEPTTAIAVARHCAFWRRLIDANRGIETAVGFAFWKRATVAPLLWSGREVRFVTTPPPPADGERIAVWRSRCSPSVAAELERRQDIVEVEDGFIRSAGLGADCVPPLSIVVDELGIYFDPGKPSDLERILERESFSPEILDRARDLRAAIVSSGVSKYGSDVSAAPRRVADRRHILVPGQVEDDRSILTGGTMVKTNLELLRRVREAAPDAYILYKPHPDVEAGHRIGAIAEQSSGKLADEIVRGEAISPLIAMVDEVHVNTSLAGFEALLRGKTVTTHGVPFYAGWGLTNDLAEIPQRRTKRRSLDELVAAVLLLYPRYLDPVTGLPCPPEILIKRLAEPARDEAGVLVRLRRLQGQARRLLSSILPR